MLPRAFAIGAIIAGIVAYVRDRLGHGSIQFTVDTYGHLIPVLTAKQ